MLRTGRPWSEPSRSWKSAPLSCVPLQDPVLLLMPGHGVRQRFFPPAAQHPLRV